MALTKWEYTWRTSYWEEVRREGETVVWINYAHKWMPDLQNATIYPDQPALNAIGALGWELVTVTRNDVSLMTRTSPLGESYGTFPTYTLHFKRPLVESDDGS